MAQQLNHIPHSKYDSAPAIEEQEDYVTHLARTVGEACDRFLESRGLNHKNFHFGIGGSSNPKNKIDPVRNLD